MRAFDIVKRSSVPASFRVARVKSDFGCEPSHANERFCGEIDFPQEWNIGAIVGGSGTGKTSIAREIFGENITTENVWTNRALIDDMPASASVEEIERAFYAVGLGSVPNWLKPFSVLSNGEKMRAEMARALLERDLIVFDEFTSTIDRVVARTLCISLCKAIKKHYPGKRFVAVTCHKDVTEWLDADWVFDTDEMRQRPFAGARSETKEKPSCDVAGGICGDVLRVITI